MKSKNLILAGLLALAASSAQAGTKDFNVQYHNAIVEDGNLIHETRRQNYSFRAEIISDQEGVKNEVNKEGGPFVTAAPDENYSVRLYNPLPVRVAVNLTVDGLNSITGKPCGISDGQKWMIEPYSSVTIPGWQVSDGETRRFFFTDKPRSYAKWRGDETGKDLSANCGVIGAAYFWNQKELDQYSDEHPSYRYSQRPVPYSSSRAKSSNLAMGAAAPPCEPRRMDKDMKKEADEEQAGTGMGERQSHPTFQVSFDYDRGMYRLSQALVIHYDFAKKVMPNPFPEEYAPEM